MCKGKQLILLLILVATVWAPWGCTPKAVLTESFIDIEKEEISIRRTHDPKTGEIVAVAFREGEEGEYKPGTDAYLWICDREITTGEKPSHPEGQDCRKRMSSSELFGKTNPWYNCGGRPCYFP